MKRILKAILPIALFITTSCASTKETKKHIASQSKIDFTQAKYKNVASNLYGYEYSLLKQFTSNKDTLENWNDLIVHLFKQKNKLLIKAYDKDKLVYSKRIKGKWRDGYFSVNRKIKPIGIPIIWFSYYERKSFLYWNQSEMIVSNIEFEAAMLLLIINGGFTDNYTNYYSRIN